MNELTNYLPNMLIIDEPPIYDIQDYDIFDEKDFRKYINDVKRCIRNSIEYRQMVQYLRNNMNMNECSYFENVNNIDTSKIRIELHHSPYTLEDLVIAVFNKRVFYKEDIDVEDVAKEVTCLHYYLLVGLIPLSETVHELVHNQFIFIPTDKVIGNYKDYSEMYSYWIPEETKEKIKNCECRTLTHNIDIDKALLQEKQITVQFDNNKQLIPLETIENTMVNRLEEIKNNSYYLEDNTHDNNIELIRGVTYVD